MISKNLVNGKTTELPKRPRKRSPPDDLQPPAAKKIGLKNSDRKTATASSSRRKPIAFHNALPAAQLQGFVCGEGSSGELGLGAGKNVTDVKRPRLNPNLTKVSVVSTGGMHAAAISADNQIITWGVNDNGALGRDTQWDGGLKDIDDAASDSEDEVDLNPKESTPTAIPSSKFPSNTRFTQVVAGDSATFALTQTGLVFGWGTFRDHNGIYGFTYDGNTKELKECQREPLLIANLKNIVQLSAGADFVLALDNSGQVFAWGCGQQCELGRRLLDRRRPHALLPTRVEIHTKRKIQSVHAAINHAFAIDEVGDTWAWGSNNFGQTGISASAGQPEAIISVPQKVPSLVGKKMKMIAGGMHHSVGLTSDGECLVWGRLDGGQTGLDIHQLLQQHPDSILRDEFDKPRILLDPTPLPIPACVHIASGSDHSLAVTSDGQAYSWGFNATYQCGQGTDDDVLTATLIEGKATRENKIVWAGAGGQYSMLASSMAVLK